MDSRLSVFLTFLRFGLLAWGGPVAQIAMIRDELVVRRGWIAPEKFRRALALYQALPGPEAHELCVYLGMVRAGRWGGFLAGVGFMLPGFLAILALAVAYTHVGPQTLLPLFVGVAPAVAALIARAATRIARHLLVTLSLVAAALAAVALTLLGVHFLLVFAVCALWQGLWSAGHRRAAILAAAALAGGALALSPALPIGAGGGYAAGSLLVEGLKAGLLSFGGAYTAIPVLHDSMVGHFPEVTEASVLDAVALASVVPAPLIVFGTFLGYLAGGLAGALAMTVGIFLPAFAFTLIGHDALERLIENRSVHGVLDGISAGVVGLLAVTAFDIVLHVATGAVPVAIFAAALAAFVLVRNPLVVPAAIVLGGLAGWLLAPPG